MKTRTIVVADSEWDVAAGRIVNYSGKFENEAPHCVRDYDTTFAEERFGDSSEGMGAYWTVGKSAFAPVFDPENRPDAFRYYCEDTQGFVTELTARQYLAAREAQAVDDAVAEALEEANDVLRDAEDEEHGPCDSCVVAYVNTIRCHETGCPRYSRLVALRRRVRDLEDA